MTEFLCTFGCGSPMANYVQPVLAEDDSGARRAMHRFYADRWAFCYKAGECTLNRNLFVTLPTIEVHGDDIYVSQGPIGATPKSETPPGPKFKYKVRLTRMLNTWVEVEAATQEEAENAAFDEVIGKEKDDPCWSDDDDVQVEDDTHCWVDGEWKNARYAPKECGGEGRVPGEA